MALPNWMNFRKSSKGAGVIFNPKIYTADFGHLHRALTLRKVAEKLNYDFPKLRDGDQWSFGIFPKILPSW